MTALGTLPDEIKIEEYQPEIKIKKHNWQLAFNADMLNLTIIDSIFNIDKYIKLCLI